MIAEMEFGLGEMADTIRESKQRFATDKIAPIAPSIDAEYRFPIELWPQMSDLRLVGSRHRKSAGSGAREIARRTRSV
ncbi:MAG: hypothetical protein NVS3B5_17820 [Sphingomicrobium sp.]